MDKKETQNYLINVFDAKIVCPPDYIILHIIILPICLLICLTNTNSIGPLLGLENTIKLFTGTALEMFPFDTNVRFSEARRFVRLLQRTTKHSLPVSFPSAADGLPLRKRMT